MRWTPNFTRYFVARSVSVFGDAMLLVASALAIGAIHGATGIGVVLAAWMVPFLGFILFGGVFADRIGARPLMLGADLVRLAAQGTVAVGFLTGVPSLWLLIACSAVSGAASAMYQPGVNGIIPLITDDPQRANATIRVANAIAELLGPAAAGILFGFAGAGVVYTVDAATFAVSAVCLAFVRVGPVPRAERSSMAADLVAGWHEFRSRTWLWGVILVWVVFGVFLFGPLLPLGATLISGTLGPAAYGWTQSAVGAGTILGGLAALRLRPARPLAAGAVAMTGYVLLPLAIALHAGLPVLLAAAVANGAAWAFWSVMWQTSVQTQVPPRMLNRLTAYEVLGSDGSLPVGQSLAGPVSSWIGAERVLAASVTAGLLGCAALLLTPTIRNLRRTPDPAAVPAHPS
ncbi:MULTISPECIES: MFS transporter [Catenuloplanes]|uniref:MFS transporter n=1 Tax=Catenuloplanes niger TaxID=587534 RepID=A0AAE3ZXY8_9ACTN|nr:MFS transporter [Catenuloplanes niger]MDR7328114.1 hypothetical protein [Catenuloplanes niger]